MNPKYSDDDLNNIAHGMATSTIAHCEAYEIDGRDCCRMVVVIAAEVFTRLYGAEGLTLLRSAIDECEAFLRTRAMN
jgi:hypothetical protein